MKRHLRQKTPSASRLNRRQPAKRSSVPGVHFEKLEPRCLLAVPDLQVVDSWADGYGSFFVEYKIIGADMPSFRWGVYAATDTVFGGDVLVDSYQETNAVFLSVGSHTKILTIGTAPTQMALPGAGSAEIEGDYSLLVVGDDNDQVSEVDNDPFNEDNQVAFAGVYHPSGGGLYVHGNDSSESATLTTSGPNIILNVSGLPTPLSYAGADVSHVELRGHGGDDLLDSSGTILPSKNFGGSGNDIALGGGGDDLFVGGPGDDSVTGGLGNDVYQFDTDIALGIDVLVESAGGGSDTLDFSPTTTRSVAANLGTATIQIVNLGLNLSLGSGSNFENIIGGELNDSLTGNGRANVLIGNTGNDTLAGLAGNDIYRFDCDGALGTDTISETVGTDTLDFGLTSTRTINVNLSNAAAQVVNAGLTLVLGSGSNMEKVIGGDLGDTLTGNTLNNSFVGGLGNDVMAGGSNHDTYFFDTDTPLGSDSINEAGGGIDLLDFRSTTTLAISIDLSNPAAQVVNANLSLQLNSGATIEKVIGGSKNDTITGNSLSNVLLGGGGHDVVNGGTGRDILIGGGGLDNLSGGGDDDLLIAGTTAYDANQTALNILRNEWNSSVNNYLTRVANIRSGVGGYRLQASGAGATVFNDGTQVDTLNGNADRDWFFASAIDLITDLAVDEFKDLLP
jgi:Ca2+-binding RTX toxin-like protein